MKKMSIKKPLPLLVVALILLFTLFITVFGVTNRLNVGAFANEANETPVFSVETDGFVNGSTIMQGEQLVVRLRLSDSFWGLTSLVTFYRIDTTTVNRPVGATWTSMGTLAPGVRMVEQDLANYLTQDVFEGFVHFRAVFNRGDGSTVTYYTSHILSVVIVNVPISDAGVIAEIDAFFQAPSGAMERLNIASTSPQWVNTNIDLIVTTRNPSVPVRLQFAFASDFEDGVIPNDAWIFAGREGTGMATRHRVNLGHQTLGRDSDGNYFLAYSGILRFRSTSDAGVPLDHSGSVFISIDTQNPTFTPDATIAVPGVAPQDRPSYALGSVSPYSVVFNIVPTVTYETMPSRMGSGMRFEYSFGIDEIGQDGLFVWHTLVPEPDGTFIFTLNQSRSVLFRGISGAGRITELPQRVVRIDTVRPVLNLTATDSNNRPIVSYGQTPAPGVGISGFASNFITFETTNLATGPTGNVSQVRFLLSIDGGAFQPFSSPGTFVGPFVNRTFTFRAQSEAMFTWLDGSRYEMYDEISFTVSVLQSDTHVLELYQPIDLTAITRNGWVFEYIPVYLRLPNVMNQGIAEYEFRIRNQHAQNLGGELIIDSYRVENGYTIFRALLGSRQASPTLNTWSVNNISFEIFAFDRARNESNYILTPPIRIDLVEPTGTLVASLAGTDVVLSQTDWAAGMVEIRVTPTPFVAGASGNISGIRFFRLVGGFRDIETQISAGGYFFFQTSTSGVFEFEMVSGAGASTFFRDVVINIDLTPITFNSFTVSRFNHTTNEYSYLIPDLQTGGAIETWLLDIPIGAPLHISFFTNHQTHFRVLYQPFSTAISDNFNDGGTVGSFVIDPMNHVSGLVQYAFTLQSLAVDSFGVRSTSRIIVLQFYIDARGFDIGLIYTAVGAATQGWTQGIPDTGVFQFVINIFADGAIFSQNELNNLVVQFNLHHFDGSESGWQTADSAYLTVNPNDTVTIPGETLQSLTWLFGGVNRLDPFRPSFQTGQSLLNGQYIGYSFNGRISVRVISEGGRMSDGVAQTQTDIRLDGNTPSPLNALERTGDIRGVAGSPNHFRVYTQNFVYLTHTSYALHPSFNIYRHFAPTVFYFISLADWVAYTGNTTPPFGDPTAITALTVLTGRVRLTAGQDYFIIARNEFFPSVRSEFLRITQVSQIGAPSAYISVERGGTDQQTGNLLINFLREAVVNLRVVSTVPFFIEYRIGGNPQDQTGWTRHHPNAAFTGPLPASTVPVVFVGDIETYNYVLAQGRRPIMGNFISDVHFRVVTLAGVYALFGNTPFATVHIRMDAREPQFRAEITSGGRVLDLNFNPTDPWLTEEAFIRLIPQQWVHYIDEHGNPATRLEDMLPEQANPGGVRYTVYFFGSEQSRNLPGDGTFFSTGALATAMQGTGVGWTGNGILDITIRARSIADNNNYYTKSIFLQIDQMPPNFDITGTVVQGTNHNTITSGNWVAVDFVNISININAASVSGVTYYFFITQDRVNQPTIYDFNLWETLSAGAANFTQNLTITNMARVWVIARSGYGTGRWSEPKYFDVNIDNFVPIINAGSIVNNYNIDGTINFDNPFTFYIDTMITFEAVNLDFARYNNFPLPYGHIIGTNTVDNSATGGLPGGRGGHVHIVVQNMAGLRAELVFFMTVFELTINTITLAEEHYQLLHRFNDEFLNALDIADGRRSLTASREAMFQTQIGRLFDRVEVLRRTVNNFRYFLRYEIYEEHNFTLASYWRMHGMINYFVTPDSSVRFPDWLQAYITQGAYAQKYQRLVAEFNILHLQMVRVQLVERMVAILPAVNVVARADYQNVRNVYNEYRSLTNAQQAVFSANLFNKLMELMQRTLQLLLTDPDSGIRIAGPNLAGNVALEVNELARTSGRVQGAQITLLEVMPPGSPRAIIYVKEFSLTDLGAGFATGIITMNIPVPEDFRNFRRFAVYILSPDGAITPIPNVRLNARGTEIYFTTSGLATFILAVDAEVDVNLFPGTVFGQVGDVEIDGELLIYITWAAVSLFAVLLALVIFLGIRHKLFIKRYNKVYKRSLHKRGMTKIPKGKQPEARSNPKDAHEKFKY